MANQYKQQIDGIMSRDVSRGDFLKYVGVAMLSLVGFVGFLKNLHEVVPSDKKNSGSGYGGSPYGH